MASVQEHYDSHLAPLYSWMNGGAQGPRERFAGWLRELGVQPSHIGAPALDLGAGNGFQSLPLAAAGFAVTAIDLSAPLLRELAADAAAAGLEIRTVCTDLRSTLNTAGEDQPIRPEAIICMGDTLTHLASREDVAALLESASQILAPDGWLLLGFRDYSVTRTGAERFIPVKSDAERILTCFLDYGPTHIAVHDIVHTHADEQWRMQISVYEKLRLDPAWVRARLTALGFAIVQDATKNGLVSLAARRPNSLS